MIATCVITNPHDRKSSQIPDVGFVVSARHVKTLKKYPISRQNVLLARIANGPNWDGASRQK